MLSHISCVVWRSWKRIREDQTEFMTQIWSVHLSKSAYEISFSLHNTALIWVVLWETIFHIWYDCRFSGFNQICSLHFNLKCEIFRNNRHLRDEFSLARPQIWLGLSHNWLSLDCRLILPPRLLFRAWIDDNISAGMWSNASCYLNAFLNIIEYLC